ncbi:hypothetical protein [Pyrobaculum aerophilum]|uniref:Uncharacterized protein n=1 Tax=Pyrobaculum aerophilum TaxID=13773 RepID=A0A371QYK5_9CREN|nr:hypothetical protein [Pyrobaculum aerophilum]RFA95827.1 hypothetical protein CGL52_12215 [Pyrobaculum aerophilum]RFA96197.1 hypothetical protein CGL51_05730 [Pyrobaculum aerophilum]
MTLEIVIGSVIESTSERRYTICPADKTTGVGFELTPEGQLILFTIFFRMNYPISPIRHTSDLLQCTSPLCLLFRFADYSELEEEPGQYQLKMAPADPVGLAIGLALAHYLDAKYGGGWLVEIYSDAWPQFTDLLATAKPLDGVLRVYTSTYDPKAVVADRVVMAVSSITYEGLSMKKEWKGGKMCRPLVPEPVAEVTDKEVLELLKTVWESGGFLSLKYAQERFGDVVIKASQMGLIKIDTLTLTVRITDLGLRALGA